MKHNYPNGCDIRKRESKRVKEDKTGRRKLTQKEGHKMKKGLKKEEMGKNRNQK